MHPETSFVAATSGVTNLCVSVVCPDTAALYTYLTTRVAALSAVERVETVPTVRTVKRTGVLSPA